MLEGGVVWLQFDLEELPRLRTVIILVELGSLRKEFKRLERIAGMKLLEIGPTAMK